MIVSYATAVANSFLRVIKKIEVQMLNATSPL